MASLKELIVFFLWGFHLAACHHKTFNEASTIEKFKHGFDEGHIVPDVISTFDPQASLMARWSDATILRHPGQQFPPKDVATQPVFEVIPDTTGDINPNEVFTLVMVDPDSPSQQNPSGAKLHLLGTSLRLQRPRTAIETYFLYNETQLSVDYLPPVPEPGTGPHRYTMLLYKGAASPASLSELQTLSFNRTNFNVTAFSAAAGLKGPYAGAFMKVETNAKSQGAADAKANNSQRLKDPSYLILSTILLILTIPHLS